MILVPSRVSRRERVAANCHGQPQSSGRGPCWRQEDNSVHQYGSDCVPCSLHLQVKVAADSFIHLRVFRSLQGEVSLVSFQMDKGKDDPIEYF